MTDIDPNPSLPAPTVRTCRPNKARWVVSLTLIIIGIGILALWPRHIANNSNVGATFDKTAMEEKINALEQKVATLESRIDEMNARSTANADSADTSKGASYTALSASLDNLQSEVKETGRKAAQNLRSAQIVIATGIAFDQLRASANSGRSFANELAALRTATKNDPSFQEPLNRLEPYAAKGAPALPTLREQFTQLIAPAATEIEKATAEHWWQRVLAELKGLVVIRPLHGGSTADSALTAMETALAQDDLPAALDAMKNLPPEAQATLKDWRAGADARMAIDDALRMMSDRLISASSAIASPNSEPVKPALASPAAPDDDKDMP